MEITPIAHIRTDFPTKFGLPRQSGLVEGLTGRIVFEPAFRQPEAFKGLEGFSHIWLLWDFSLAHMPAFSATVKPPRLGGKTHVGVFATRSPHRPNSIGLSSVRLDRIEYTEKGPVLHVSGVDMADGTPIYDIKPYVADYDSHPDARCGFTEATRDYALPVSDPDGLIAASDLTPDQQAALLEVLSQDPRPSYDADSTGSRRYGFFYCGYDVRFRVNEQGLYVTELVKTAP